MKVVIIGSGIAAVEAASKIRELDANAQIDIFSRENVLPYRRPALTRMISETLSDIQFYIKPEKFYHEQNIRLHLGTIITSIDRKNKTVSLAGGQLEKYDKLLIATGGRCFIPPIQGVELPGVLSLREKNDLDTLLKNIDKGIKNIVIIGGGLLGLETADNLSKLGVNVTVVEACPSMLPNQIDAEGAELFAMSIKANSNIKIRYGVFISHISGHDQVNGLLTQSGERIPCELVIISAGVKCNIELGHDALLKTKRTIDVDEYMQTSDPDIYAAGDCASCMNDRFIGLWNAARDQGAVAGANIAGHKINYIPAIYGARLTAFGTKLFSVGDIGNKDGEYKKISTRDELHLNYRKLFFKDGALVGGVLLGDVSMALKLQKAVEEHHSLEQVETDNLICR
ncbi:MAG: FAD-dependent oxidoreductase [Victivallaceae bacterium]